MKYYETNAIEEKIQVMMVYNNHWIQMGELNA
jgi:hypothetical protein